jgi:hypothetical protein
METHERSKTQEKKKLMYRTYVGDFALEVHYYCKLEEQF